LLASDTKCRQKTESLFAKAFKSLLQQNLPKAAISQPRQRISVTQAAASGAALSIELAGIVQRPFLWIMTTRNLISA
jgi:hypothetical protein